jgi:hypothetical protein
MSPEDRLDVELAESLNEAVELLGGEEAVLQFLKKAVRLKEQQRLSHKKNYLRKQLILSKAIAAGLDKEFD